MFSIFKLLYESLTAYSVNEWLLLFYIYCFLGWCFESAYVSLKQHKLVNRGFMHGPMLPIYGSGAIVMLFAAIPVKSNPVLVYIFGLIGATALEYVVGAVMERLFKVRYWDYSYQKFNLHGYICLSSSIAWGFFTCAMIYWINDPFQDLIFHLSDEARNIIDLVITVVAGADFMASLKTALDLRDMIIQAEKMKEELEHMKRRVEIIDTFVRADMEERMEERAEGLRERAEEMRKRFASFSDTRMQEFKESDAGTRLMDSISGTEKRVQELRTYMAEHAKKPQVLKEFTDEIGDYRLNLAKLAERRRMMISRDKLDLLRRNPDATYNQIPGYLEELRTEMEEYLAHRNEQN